MPFGDAPTTQARPSVWRIALPYAPNKRTVPMPPNASASTDAPKEPAGNTPDSAPLQTESDGSTPVRFVPTPYAASTYPPRRLATEVQALRAVLKPPSAPPPRDALW